MSYDSEPNMIIHRIICKLIKLRITKNYINMNVQKQIDYKSRLPLDKFTRLSTDVWSSSLILVWPEIYHCMYWDRTRKSIPRTAHGKLKAVITPTIPSGFHTCGVRAHRTIHNYTSYDKMVKKLLNNHGLISNLKHHMIWTCKEKNLTKLKTQNQNIMERN